MTNQQIRFFLATVALCQILGLGACGEKAEDDDSDSTFAAAASPAYLAPSHSPVYTRSAPPSFATYDEAIDWGHNSSGLSCESADTERSSWINSADFCSDGSGDGYAIFDLRGKEYIHAGVPESVWLDFTQAPSL